MQPGTENFASFILRFAGIELNQKMLPVFLGLHFAAMLAWPYVFSRLYAELRHNYPRLYEKLGSPQFFYEKEFINEFQDVQIFIEIGL